MFPEGGFTNKINEEYNKYVSGVLCLPARHPLILDAGNVSVSVPLMILLIIVVQPLQKSED